VTDGELLTALSTSQRLGFLGSRPIAEVVEHARAFVDALDVIRGTVIDLGSGGGVPGLVIAVDRPDLRLVLVDRRGARTDHLSRLVGRLGLGGRVSVVTADAATVALPSPAEAVVARGFGPPDLTARVAARLLAPSGRLIVSEPPTPDPTRWPAELLAELDLLAVPWADRRVAVFRHVPRETPEQHETKVSRET
jgi:16S rRNA (guanine527-N7)-methyltransferase